MRWALVRISVAVTTMVVLAFAVPLGLVVKEMARDRALSNAERQAAAIGPALAITSDQDRLRRAVASTEAGTVGRIAVHVPLPGEPTGDQAVTIGEHRVTPGELHTAGHLGRPATLGVDGGVALLQPTAVSGGRIAVVEVFVPDGELFRGVGAAWLVLAGVGLALVIGSVAVADRLGSRTVRPAQRLAGAARELGEGRLSVRVPVEGPAELRSAASAFNAMAQQVTHLLAKERELAADLSHRLRTPLTVLRLNAASLGEGDAAEHTRQAVTQLENEVDQIIHAASQQRVQPPAAGSVEDTDAAEVVIERLEFWSALAEDQGRDVRLAGVTEPIRVPVARADLVAALDALLGNVFRHTPEGSAFAVDVHRAPGAGGTVTVLVSDAGPGIEDPEAALRRGHGAGGPGSTGIGLDIVRRLAESTGGEVRIGRSALGGSEVRMHLAAGPGVHPAPVRRSRAGRRRTGD